MWYRIGADLVLLLHLAFVLFVVTGGLLLLKWPRLAWLHLPAAIWGAIVEYTGWICPLTPIEHTAGHGRRVSLWLRLHWPLPPAPDVSGRADTPRADAAGNRGGAGECDNLLAGLRKTAKATAIEVNGLPGWFVLCRGHYQGQAALFA